AGGVLPLAGRAVVVSFRPRRYIDFTSHVEHSSYGCRGKSRRGAGGCCRRVTYHKPPKRVIGVGLGGPPPPVPPADFAGGVFFPPEVARSGAPASSHWRISRSTQTVLVPSLIGFGILPE